MDVYIYIYIRHTHKYKVNTIIIGTEKKKARIVRTVFKPVDMYAYMYTNARHTHKLPGTGHKTVSTVHDF